MQNEFRPFSSHDAQWCSRSFEMNQLVVPGEHEHGEHQNDHAYSELFGEPY